MSQIIPEQNSPFLRLNVHKLLKSKEQAREIMLQVVRDGGEGIVLRNPRGFYEGKRSWGALKMKPADDAEVSVKSSGQKGDIVEVEWKGKIFSALCVVPKIEKEAIATMKYFGIMENGIPVKPILIKVASAF